MPISGSITWRRASRTSFDAGSVISPLMPARTRGAAALEYRRVLVAFDDQKPGQPALQPRQRMVHENIAPGDLQLEFDHSGAAGGDGRRLDVRRHRRADRRLVVHAIEDLADHVERGRRIRAADAEEDPDRLADLGLHWMLGRQRADSAVEDEVLRPLREQLLHAELVVAALPVR